MNNNSIIKSKRSRNQYETINTINNNNNNDNEYNTKIYNSVFNNVYLKKIIFNHLSIYNILHSIDFQSHKELEQFKYKEYLNNIKLYYNCDYLNQLPENIKYIQIYRTNKEILIDSLNSIPNHIESIKLLRKYSGFEIKSKFSTLNSTVLSKVIGLHIELIDSDDQIDLNKILPSVTELKIESQSIIELKKEMLPSSLKRIFLDNVKSIENGCLLESLSSSNLSYCSPSIINQIISNNLVKLEFICDNYKDYYKFENNIIFPESLQELSIQCYSFSSKLPNRLKSLSLTIYKYEDTIIFPSTLEIMYVSIIESKKELFTSKDSIPCNLKSLEMGFSSIVDNNNQPILPDKLEDLSFIYYSDIYFNQVLQVNQLPSSLTSLCLGNSYNQVININVLPSSLKKLILGGRYSQIINPLAIPQQLDLLIIQNPNYNHPINLPVSTHPNTLIKCDKLNLYYDPSNTSIRKLQLSNYFNSPLSTLQLQDKSSLEYLHLGNYFNQPIKLSDLPINNNIKTLELSYKFNQTINLEYFQNLETIILNDFSNPIITTTITNQQQDIIYSNYNLKNIILSQCSNQFLINLDKNFYQFIKLKEY